MRLLIYLFLSIFYTCASMKPQINLVKNYNFNKKYIYISPGGIKGFYMLGVISYIKDNYDVSDYHVIGASAGSWMTIPFLLDKNEFNNLFLNDIFKYYDSILNSDDKISFYNIQRDKKEICNKYEKIEYKKINIISNKITLTGIKSVVINDFKCINDVTDYCIASSYIPFITGKFICILNNNLFIDGGFFMKKTYNKINPYFSITYNMWGFDFESKNIKALDKKDLKYFKDIYNYGYKDSHKNKKILDNYFISV